MTQIRTILVSGSIPTVNQLALGDIAINTVDGKAFLKKYSGSIQSIVDLGASASYLYPLHQDVYLTGSLNISGSEIIKGYIELQPVTTNIDTTKSASYIYVSGSTNDLYFSQNGNGYANTTRLRWLEGNLYTGLLNGGIITSASSTTFNISSGSGIIVNLNASINANPYPTVQYVNWGNLTNQTLTYLTSSIQTFVGIDSSGSIIQQTSPWTDGQYNTSIQIGTVLHQNKSTINGRISYPNVAYGYKQRTYDFIKAFGPLKLSGYTLFTSSSLGLTVGNGTAFADGRNYQVDPNNPSYIIDPGTNTSKVFRYYQSGSDFVQDTNGGLGYTGIDPTNYNPGGSGSLASVTPSRFTIQRVFWYPNSATQGIVVYYGNAEYATLSEGILGITTEVFSEVENTKQNAVYLGAIVIRGNKDFTGTIGTDYQIVAGGLFRASVGGGGGGGGGGSVTPAFPYTGSAEITGSLNVIGPVSASLFTGSLTGSLFGTASNALTASYLNPLAQTVRLTGSLVITGSVIISSSATFVNVGPAVFTGSAGTGSAVTVYKSGSTAFDIQGSSGQLFAVTDSLTGSLFSVNTAAGLPVIEAFSDNTVNIGKFGTYPIKVAATGTLAIITGSFTGSFTGSATTAVTASYALTSSFPWFQTGSNIAYVGGNVGINTTSPLYRLDVNGSARFQTNTYINVAATTNSGLDLINSVTSSVFAKFGYLGGGSNDSYIGSITNNNFSIRSVNTDRITVLNTGLVGINTASPTAQLQVKGSGTTSATTALRIENSSTTPSLTVLDNGFVGIRRSNPTVALDVSGSVIISGSVSLVSSTGIVLYDSSGNGGGRIYGSYGYLNGEVFIRPLGAITDNFVFSPNNGMSIGGFTIGGTAGSPPAYGLAVSGSVGIGTRVPTTQLDVSGSGRFTGNLTVTGSIIAASFTGSLSGSALSATSASFATTASYWSGSIVNATSASFASTASFYGGSVTSASFASTASFYGGSVTSASFALSASNSISSSYAAQAGNTNTINVNLFGSPVDSYLLFSNVVGTTGVAIGGDGDLRYNASTNVLTVVNVSATSLTGSLFGTASNATFALGAGTANTASFVQTAQTASYVLNAVSSSFAVSSSRAVSSSFATTASYWSGSILNATSASFTSTASYVNTLNQNVTINGTASAAVYKSNNFAFAKSDGTILYIGNIEGNDSDTVIAGRNYIVGSGTPSINLTDGQIIYTETQHTFVGNVIATGSFKGNVNGSSSYATSASFASTASRVSTLNQNVLITGSLTVGATSLGSNENTIAVGPPPAAGAGEGGQILLAAAGGAYTSASMLDTYQDSFRLLRGTNAGSDAFKLKVDLHSGQVQIPNYNSPTAFTGAPVNSLATDTNGNILTVQGYSGIVTINTMPPVNFDIQNGIIVNVF